MPTPIESIVRCAAAAALVVGISGCSNFGASGPSPTEADFMALQPGMTQQEVLARVGRPTWIFGVRQENLSIWNYRYSHSACVIYQLSMRPDGTLRDAATGSDPGCDGPNDRS